MITEVFIEGQRLDISADISSLLTFAIDDIKDFASRQTAFSKTIILPGTVTNNAIFGNIFETGISNDYDPLLNNIGYNFNAAKSAACIIFQDNLQTFKGTLRLLEIIKDHGNIEYEAAMNGELTSLSVSLSTGLLETLDFSAYNTILNQANIVASWDNTPGSGLYFPNIDYGQYSVDKHSWDMLSFRPALYVKEYIDKIFTAAKFRYSSVLFNTDRFKRLIIPNNQKVLLSKSGSSKIIEATKTTSQEIVNSITSHPFDSILWDTHIAGGFTYSAGNFTYNGATMISVTLNFFVTGTRRFTTPGTFTAQLRKNGTILATQTYNSPYSGTTGWSFSGSINTSIVTSDVLDIFVKFDGTGSGCIVTIENGSYLDVPSLSPVLLPVDYLQNITINDSIPKNIRRVDFLVSIVKLFNLYVYESPLDEKLLYITPFVDFYSTNSSNAIDWTYKLNRNEVIKVKPLSEINSKIYNFNYKDDSDYFNDLYKKRYNQGYGSHIFDSQFEFSSQANKLDLIFAATPLVGYNGEDKVYSTIFKKSNEIEEQLDSVIRILQTKKVTGVTSWDIVNRDGTVYGSYTNYGYAGHFDDPDNVGNDLNFGLLGELFFVLVTGDLTKNQFNIYWSAYMAEITDKDSKMLTAKFHLTPMDIFNLDFSKYVVVDNVLFRLNKITDYNVTVPSDCEVELLKVINTIY